MRDGFTRRLEAHERPDPSFIEFSKKWKAVVVVVSGAGAGSEYPLLEPSITLGRKANWTFDDETMSKEHAVLELSGGAIRLRDLGSRNGTLVNGSDIKAIELAHGDRFQLGETEFQFLLENRPKQTPTYDLSEE
jgi:pSer/pThr/pTyr-binding forkhead associated (FHA) protein